MIHNLVSVQNILSRVYRTFKLEDPDWIYDAVEWAAEALEDIGHVNQLVRRTREVSINSFNADLPDDLVYLEMVTLDGERVSYSGREARYDTKQDDVTYQLEPGKLKIGIDCGTVTLTYRAFPVDEQGFPLVPDIYDVKEALSWRIMSRMMLGGYVPKAQGLNWQIADQKYELFRKAAENQIKMPSPDEMEMIRQFFHSLTPDYSHWKEKMEGLNDPDNIDVSTGGTQQSYAGNYTNGMKKYSYPNQINKTGQNN